MAAEDWLWLLSMVRPIKWFLALVLNNDWTSGKAQHETEYRSQDAEQNVFLTCFLHPRSLQNFSRM
jgi:hypothetical protein